MGLFFGQNRSSESPGIESNVKLGYLYNFHAISNANFVPDGWHIPTSAEFAALLSQFIDALDASVKLKDILGWDAPTDGDGQSGFDSRAAGYRGGWYMDGHFGAKGTRSCMASSNYASNLVYHLLIEYQAAQIAWDENTLDRAAGFSVRLLKNDSTNVGSITDLDGNIYTTVKIGDQVWLAQNWACKKFKNGTDISTEENDYLWAELVTPAYCAYDNDESNVFLPW